MTQLDDEDLMPFGMHRGKAMSQVPAEYYHWLWWHGKKDEQQVDPVADYIRRRIPAFKMENSDLIWE